MLSGRPSHPRLDREQLMSMCNGNDCKNIQCKWVCNQKPVEMKHRPKCDVPKCRVVCDPIKTPTCKVESSRPSCAVKCHYNKDTNCYKCGTVCQKLETRLKCVNEPPNCKVVCQEPVCEKEYELPKNTPKPVCKLICPSSSGGYSIAKFDKNYES